MILTRYAVCSELRRKPITRLVADTRAEAENALAKMREQDQNPEVDYWIAELGPECEAWRYLAPMAQDAP
jgi:hypothetical protein